MARSAMFPLGTVLFPGHVLPLRIFEPRYRQMVHECIRDDAGFGVVLIERGSEVGGGDVRTLIGTQAHIVRAQPYPDGRWSIVAVGTGRIRVVEWLADDPYPCAETEPLLDDPLDLPAEGAINRAAELARSVLALATELGEPVPSATFDLSDDPLVASYQLCALSPLGPADRQALLGATGAADRLSRLTTLLEDEQSFYRARLAMETDPNDPE